MWFLANLFAEALMFSWLLAAVAVVASRNWPELIHPWFRTIYFELRPFYLPAAAIRGGYLLAAGRGPLWATWVGIGLDLLAWLVYRGVGGDDDRWKRRWRKVGQAIQRLGSRLIVVPDVSGT